MSIDSMTMLSAYYSLAYRRPERSGTWGTWSSDWNEVPAAYRHNPERKLGNGEADIASVFMPVIGPYDATDPDVWEYHILLAKASGIQAFSVDLMGHVEQPQPTDGILPHVEAMLALADKLSFKLAVCFQDRSCFPPFDASVTSRSEAVDRLSAQFLRMSDTIFKSPAYVRLEGRPVVTALNSGVPEDRWDSPFFLPEEWDLIRRELRGNLLVIQNYQPRRPVLDFSLWESVIPWLSVYLTEGDTDEEYWEHTARAIAQRPSFLVSGLVTPGYDDRGSGAWGRRQPRVFSRRQGAKYSSIWEDVLRHQAKFIQIATWNGLNDGTCIEPVKEIVLHKNAAAPGWGYRELLATREYAARLTHEQLWPLPALFLPERLFRLRKSGAPVRRGDRIRLYLLEGDIPGATLGLEQAGV